MPQQPALTGQGTQSITFNPASRRTAGAGELASPRRCPAAAHSPQKKTSEEVFYFLNPKTNPEGALRAQERQNHADRSGNRSRHLIMCMQQLGKPVVVIHTDATA